MSAAEGSVIPGDAQDVKMSAHIEEAQDSRDGLGDYGGVGGSGHARVQLYDEEQIQHDI